MLLYHFRYVARVSSLRCRGLRYNSTKSPSDGGAVWFYATDVPKSKPNYFDWKPDKSPVKFESFSTQDSTRLENAYQAGRQNLTVKEDGLFTVELAKREFRPTYWDGPIYEVRRGTWYYANGSKLTPCSEKLAQELESIYKEVHPEFKTTNIKSSSRVEYALECTDDDVDTLKFGSDPTVGWLFKSDDSVSVLQKISSSLGGARKVVRGYNIKPEKEKEKGKKTESDDNKTDTIANRTSDESSTLSQYFPWQESTEKKLEYELTHDYDSKQLQDDQRPIEHLILCVHGIGQKLSQRVESVNFVHDINVFRKLMKTIRLDASGRQSTEKPDDSDRKSKVDNRVQVLPVLWRQEITFGREPNDSPTKGVTLEDINVEGIPSIRNLVGDVVVDVLLYNEPTYKKQMLDTVTYQLNKIVRDFCRLNPTFAKNPKVSLIGHSLGSVICYEVLATRPTRSAADDVVATDYLEFSVSDFFTVGSPLGLFLLINARKVERLNVKEMHNLFHPSDPISYRLEPLVHPLASRLQPKLIPYTKGGLTSQLQELSEFGQKISEGASVMWDSVASLYKSEILNVLFSGKELDVKSGKVRTTSSKKIALTKNEVQAVRSVLSRLNSSGHIDYSLQEGVLDISIIAALASHVSYFENADIASFVLDAIRK
jgi:hypothetical protein